MFSSFGSLSVSQTLHLVYKKDFSFICKSSDSSKVVQQPHLQYLFILSLFAVLPCKKKIIQIMPPYTHHQGVKNHNLPQKEFCKARTRLAAEQWWPLPGTILGQKGSKGHREVAANGGDVGHWSQCSREGRMGKEWHHIQYGTAFPQKTSKRIYCGNCVYAVPVLVILFAL